MREVSDTGASCVYERVIVEVKEMLWCTKLMIVDMSIP